MAKTILSEDYVVVDRGGIIENKHRVHAAVVDTRGKLLFTIGNPSRTTLLRSAAKPAQALAILETGCFSQFGFDDADLALACASHNSEDRHITRAAAMLQKARIGEEKLRCGGHAALSESVNRAWIKRDYNPTGICNNCSGKHAGMLAGATAIQANPDDYHLPDHPMQLLVKKVFEDLCDPHASTVAWAIDGCNLPAPAAPLHCMGRIYATFAAAADAAGNHHPVAERTRNQARIFNAMARYPEMVGGDGRFCTTLMEAYRGEIIGKLGADGCYGVGVRASEDTKRLGVDGAVGIAVKIEDGSIDILYSVMAEILERLQIGTADTRRKLEQFHHLKRLNTMGVVVGHVSHLFKIQATIP